MIAAVRYHGVDMEGLLTKHELVPTIGSDRTMRDWQRSGTIVTPEPFDAFGKRLRLYPDATLVQVFLHARHASEDMVRGIGAVARELFATDAFRACADVLRRSLREITSTDLAGVAELLEAANRPAVQALEVAADEARRKLGDIYGISFVTRLGQIEEVSSGRYGMRLDNGVLEYFDRRHVAMEDVMVGVRVRCDLISLGSMRDGFIVPLLGSVHEPEWKLHAQHELDEALRAVTNDEPLPSYRYMFLAGMPVEDARVWVRDAADQLRTASQQERWEDLLDDELGRYAQRHPSLTDEHQSVESPTPVAQIVGGDRWATWRAPNLFA